MVSREEVAFTGSALMRGFDALVARVTAACSWMNAKDKEVLRRVLSYHFGLRCDDMGKVASDVLQLAQHAEMAGETLLHLSFMDWYSSICLGLRRGVYRVPDAVVRSVLSVSGS